MKNEFLQNMYMDIFENFCVATRKIRHEEKKGHSDWNEVGIV